MATIRTLIGNIKGPKGDPGQAATIQVGTVSTTAYGNAAQVTNTGTSENAVFDFVIPKGMPGEAATTMSGLTLDEVTTQSSNFPVPATGESGSIVFGKIIKFFNDVKSQVQAINNALSNIIFAGETKKIRFANNATNTDIAIRAIHDDGSAASLTVNSEGLILQKLPISGSASYVLKVNFLHTTTTANGTSATTATLSPALGNYSQRKLIATCNGGSNGGRYIVSAIPTSPNIVTINWDGNTPASGTIQISLIYWE